MSEVRMMVGAWLLKLGAENREDWVGDFRYQ